MAKKSSLNKHKLCLEAFQNGSYKLFNLLKKLYQRIATFVFEPCDVSDPDYNNQINKYVHSSLLMSSINISVRGACIDLQRGIDLLIWFSTGIDDLLL